MADETNTTQGGIPKKDKRRVKHAHRQERKDEQREMHKEKMKANKHARKPKSRHKQGKRDR